MCRFGSKINYFYPEADWMDSLMMCSFEFSSIRIINLQIAQCLILTFSPITGWKNCHWRLVSLGVCCSKLSVIWPYLLFSPTLLSCSTTSSVLYNRTQSRLLYFFITNPVSINKHTVLIQFGINLQCGICTGVHFKSWCYTWTALLSANQNRLIFHVYY